MCCGDMRVTLIFFALFAIGLAMYYPYYLRIVSRNFDALEPLLSGAERRRTFFRSYLTGHYKGRHAGCVYSHFDEGPNVRLWVEPRYIPRPQGFFLAAYPRPTENTSWQGTKVYFSRKGVLLRGDESNHRIITSEEYVRRLDELSDAASIVELMAP